MQFRKYSIIQSSKGTSGAGDALTKKILAIIIGVVFFLLIATTFFVSAYCESKLYTVPLGGNCTYRDDCLMNSFLKCINNKCSCGNSSFWDETKCVIKRSARSAYSASTTYLVIAATGTGTGTRTSSSQSTSQASSTPSNPSTNQSPSNSSTTTTSRILESSSSSTKSDVSSTSTIDTTLAITNSSTLFSQTTSHSTLLTLATTLPVRYSDTTPPITSQISSESLSSSNNQANSSESTSTASTTFCTSRKTSTKTSTSLNTTSTPTIAITNSIASASTSSNYSKVEINSTQNILSTLSTCAATKKSRSSIVAFPWNLSFLLFTLRKLILF